MEVTAFSCSICSESSTSICVYCTKDACANHLCERCRRCSDCCACGMPVFHPDLQEDLANGDLSGEAADPATAEPVMNGAGLS